MNCVFETIEHQVEEQTPDFEDDYLVEEGFFPEEPLEKEGVKRDLQPVKDEESGHFPEVFPFVVHQTLPSLLREPRHRSLPPEYPRSHEEEHADRQGVVKGHVQEYQSY